MGNWFAVRNDVEDSKSLPPLPPVASHIPTRRRTRVIQAGRVELGSEVYGSRCKRFRWTSCAFAKIFRLCMHRFFHTRMENADEAKLCPTGYSISIDSPESYCCVSVSPLSCLQSRLIIFTPWSPTRGRPDTSYHRTSDSTHSC